MQRLRCAKSRTAHSGAFRCKTVALAGAVIFATALTATSAYADSPTNAVTTITSTSTTQTTFTINWTSTPGEYPTMCFQIDIMPIGGPVFVFNNDATTGTIAGLSPGTTYNVRFLTISAAPPPTDATFEEQDLTLTTQGTPFASVATSTPAPFLETTSPSITSLTSTARTATVSWVAATNPPVPLVRYIVKAIGGGKVVGESSSGSSGQSITVAGLQPNKIYEITFAAQSATGSLVFIRHVLTK